MRARYLLALATFTASGCLFGESPGCENEECDSCGAFGGESSSSFVGDAGSHVLAVDPGFERASFARCPVETALDPASIEPPIVWVPCSDASPGCERATLADIDEGQAISYRQTTTITAASSTMIAARRDLSSFDDTESLERVSLYDAATGVARVTLRALDPSCRIDGPVFGATRAWLAITGPSADVATVVSLDDLGSSPVVVANEELFGPLDVSDELVVGDELCCSATAFDVATKTATNVEIGEDVSLASGLHHPARDADFVTIYGGLIGNQTWGAVWTPGATGYAKLIESPFGVGEITSDGDTLVWTQGNETGSGDLWTSPFATSEAEVVPTKRRSFEATGALIATRANAGFYARLTSDALDLYRLSDMRHWEVASPDGDFTDLLSVDATYLYFTTETGSYRRAIAELGDGD